MRETGGERQAGELEYARPMPSVRRFDPNVGSFVAGFIFLASVPLLGGTRGLHAEINPFTVLIWLVLGIVASCFVAAAREERTFLGARTRLGRAGTVLTGFGWILGTMLVLWPARDPHDSDVRRQNRCASNLRQIGQAMLLYANEYGGRYPDRPEDLLFSPDISPEIFICPSSDHVPATGPSTRAIREAVASGGHFSYVYVARGLTSQEAGPDHVLAHEPRDNHTTERPGINVLFGDGMVEYIEEPQASRLLRELRAGRNPPTNWR